MRVSPGGGAEWKQARPVSPVVADGQFGPHDDAETVAQRVQAFDSRRVVHQTESVAIGVELTALQPRPRCYAGAHEILFEARVTPFAFGRVNRGVAALARIEPPQQIADDLRLVLLDQIPEVHVDWHASRLDPRDRLGAIVRPMQNVLDACGRQARMPGALAIAHSAAAAELRTSSSQ